MIGQLENRRDQKKSERHTVLTQCKINDIQIPLRKGRLEDVEVDQDMDVDEGETNSQSQSSQGIYSKEDK